MRDIERRELPSTSAAMRRARSDVLKRFIHTSMHEPLKHVKHYSNE
jgi:hypothetical protein